MQFSKWIGNNIFLNTFLCARCIIHAAAYCKWGRRAESDCMVTVTPNPLCAILGSTYQHAMHESKYLGPPPCFALFTGPRLTYFFQRPAWDDWTPRGLLGREHITVLADRLKTIRNWRGRQNSLKFNLMQTYWHKIHQTLMNTNLWRTCHGCGWSNIGSLTRHMWLRMEAGLTASWGELRDLRRWLMTCAPSSFSYLFGSIYVGNCLYEMGKHLKTLQVWWNYVIFQYIYKGESFLFFTA